jgi:diguanylate cyclase (GGDEF)-like protein
MNKLNIYICENFSAEFNKIIEKQGLNDVKINSYPCMCESKAKKNDAKALLENSMQNGDKGLVICSKHCDVIPMVLDNTSFEVRSTNYCFNHLASEQFINYILQRGGYIIGLGWLNNWREHIKTAGFDQETAIKFYKEFCKELVFFDAGIDEDSEKNLKELSEFLQLPYVAIPFEIDSLNLLLKSIVYGWRLNNHKEKCEKSILDIQSQCAEYSAILDLIGKIASYTNKRDTIEKIKEIFIMIFGAQHFKYWNYDYEKDSLPRDIAQLFSEKEKSFLLNKDENRFCIKIQHMDKIYGAIDVSEFLFSKYIEKYLNFAIEIVKICGLVLSNIEQYEKLINSEKELQYLSFHDSLTGLYNRTYLNEMLSISKDTKFLAVFMFDIDKLKYVNDNFGHSEGDKLILSAAEIMKKCFRESDIVARIGGDEFLAILPDCDIEMAEIFRKRIYQAITIHNNNLLEKHLTLSISIGFAVSADNIDTIENIIKKADELMYVDKLGKSI